MKSRALLVHNVARIHAQGAWNNGHARNVVSSRAGPGPQPERHWGGKFISLGKCVGASRLPFSLALPAASFRASERLFSSHPILVNEILYPVYINFIFLMIKFDSANFFNSFMPHWPEIDAPWERLSAHAPSSNCHSVGLVGRRSPGNDDQPRASCSTPLDDNSAFVGRRECVKM